MSNYNFDFAISATITDKTIAEMIKKVVEEQTGRKVINVAFKTRVRSDFGDRNTVTEFDGCIVEFSK